MADYAGSSPQRKRPSFCREWIGAIIFLLLFAGFIAFSLMMVPTSTPDVAKAHARFVQPQTGQALEATVEVELESSEIPAGYQLWIMEKHGELLWPKEPPVRETLAGRWRGTVHVAGKSGPMSLALYLVPPDGQDTIHQWSHHGDITGDYPGLRVADIAGAKMLDEVDVTLVDE